MSCDRNTVKTRWFTGFSGRHDKQAVGNNPVWPALRRAVRLPTHTTPGIDACSSSRREHRHYAAEARCSGWTRTCSPASVARRPEGRALRPALPPRLPRSRPWADALQQPSRARGAARQGMPIGATITRQRPAISWPTAASPCVERLASSKRAAPQGGSTEPPWRTVRPAGRTTRTEVKMAGRG
jgi:hypothetical protein